jgi:hypothetical protein
MAWGTTQGIQVPYPSVNANAIPFDVFRMAINYYPNRCPLLYMLMKAPLNALTFYMNSDTYRPRTTTLGGAYTSAGATLTVADSTGITNGDILEIDSERFLVTAINNSTTVTVTGAFEGTTQANHNNNSTVTIVTNARTGADVDQNALSRLPSTVAQYAQTCQQAYQVGGAFQSTGNYMDGAITPLDRDRMMAVQHVVDDFERACYYGKGAALSSTVGNQAMKGIQTICTTNKTTSPTNASSYKPSDFTRDVLQSCFNAGGNPDLILVSTGFLSGLFTWGYPLQLLDAGATELGVRPNVYIVPFVGGCQLMAAPLLGTSTNFAAIALNTNEVRLRIKRALFDKPRGSRGDAVEGDMIMEGAIDVENEGHHSWTSGITGFAVQS